MPLFWGTIAQGTATTVAVPIWSSPTMGTQSCFGQTNATTSGLYQAMTNSTNQTISTTATTLCWVDDMNNQDYYALAQHRAAANRQHTEAEHRAQLEAARQYRAQHEERMRQHEQAVVRSRELLLEHLNSEQRRTFEVNNWFVVEGGKTRSKYRIRAEGYAGNIDVMVKDRIVARLCVHCDGVPLHDHHLAQKLALEYDEERVLQVANRTRVA